MAQNIDPIGATQPAQPVQPTPDPATQRRDTTANQAATPQVQTAEKRQEATPTAPSFDVQLDAKTLRLYSEILDPMNGKVLMTIPTDYHPSSDASDTPAPTAKPVDTVA